MVVDNSSDNTISDGHLKFENKLIKSHYRSSISQDTNLVKSINWYIPVPVGNLDLTNQTLTHIII